MNDLSAITGIVPDHSLEKELRQEEQVSSLAEFPSEKVGTITEINKINETNEEIFETPTQEATQTIPPETIAPNEVPISSVINSNVDKITSLAATEESEAIKKFTAHGNQ